MKEKIHSILRFLKKNNDTNIGGIFFVDGLQIRIDYLGKTLISYTLL